MIDMDPPRHDELRGLIARRFTPRAVGVWEDKVRKVTREVLDLALPKGEFDFVHEISSEIPMQVFAEILGVPQEERREIIEIGDRLLGNQDPEYEVAGRRRAPPPAVLEPGRARDVRVRPPAGRRAAQGPEGRHHHPARVRAADASASSTSTSCCSPRRATRRRGTRSRTGCSRCSSSPTSSSGCATTRRSARPPPRRCCAGRRPCTTSAAPRRSTPSWPAREIKAGDKVTTWFVSGNRDETVFEEPDRFDVGRTPNPHMAFGPGRHPPLHGRAPGEDGDADRLRGAARRARRTSSSPAPPERLRSNFFNGIKRLPVRVTL